MKREILFKGKRVDNGEWIFGSFTNVHDTDKNPTIIPYKTNIFIPVHPDTLCQFTGLLDKNGNKIFDGDKVKSKKPFYSTNEAVVKWMDGRCGFYFIADTVGSDIINSNPFQSAYKLNSFTVEIIGNIHD